jgi:hypothetical protein
MSRALFARLSTVVHEYLDVTRSARRGRLICYHHLLAQLSANQLSAIGYLLSAQ